MLKRDRQQLICKLVKEKEISTQEELTAELNAFDLNVSQATVSRDICELSLIKVGGTQKKIKYAIRSLHTDSIPENLIEMFKTITISIESVNNLIVIKTSSGNANSAAAVLDKMSIPEILGTIAGDDTVLAITKANSDAESVVKSLRKIKC
ncbi:MAG: arginine repressor [Clostridia bacterium]|nr:arginine repressor [Clostridia bacterium]